MCPLAYIQLGTFHTYPHLFGAVNCSALHDTGSPIPVHVPIVCFLWHTYFFFFLRSLITDPSAHAGIPYLG